MAVFRVERTQGYTVMSNYHLRDKSLSLKAKGLLSQMLSLPEDWDYTLDLLFCLAQHPGQVWSRSQLYSYVWEDDLGVSGDNTVRTHIGNLRKKLADAGKNYIQNIRGVGYRFIPPALNKKD